MKDHVTLLCFLGDNIEAKKGGVFNQNQKIYKEFYGYRPFQIIAIYPETSEEDVKKLSSDLETFTDMYKWNFISMDREVISSLHANLKTKDILDSSLYSKKVYLIDKEGSLRGRDNDGDEEKQIMYGYNIESVAELNNKMEDFDYIFYTSFYPDLNNLSCDEAMKHFLTWGKKEKRVFNRRMLKEFQDEIKLKITREYENLDIEKISLPGEKMFNVLIRTSNRPENFMRCIESVLDQKYTNYKIFVCHDKIESLEYLEEYDDKIEYFPVFTKSNKKYKFNLYCNQLLAKVEDGYVI
jgi:hypothetical protein